MSQKVANRDFRKQRRLFGISLSKEINRLGKLSGWITGAGSMTKLSGDWITYVRQEVSRVDTGTTFQFQIKPLLADLFFADIWCPDQNRREMPISKILRASATIESCNPITYKEENFFSREKSFNEVAEYFVTWSDKKFLQCSLPKEISWYATQSELAYAAITQKDPHYLHADTICALIACQNKTMALKRCLDAMTAYDAASFPKLKPSGGWQRASDNKTFIDLTIELLTHADEG